jgi:hypothetical protein
MPISLVLKHTCIIYDGKEVMLTITSLAALAPVHLGHGHLIGSNSNRPRARWNNILEWIAPIPCIQDIPGSDLYLKTGYCA